MCGTVVINPVVGRSRSEGATYAIVGGWIEAGEGEEPRVVMAFPRLDSPGVKNPCNWNAMEMPASHGDQCAGLGYRADEAWAQMGGRCMDHWLGTVASCSTTGCAAWTKCAAHTPTSAVIPDRQQAPR